MNHIPNVWKLYAVRFFFNLIPAYVIERIYWEERGMTIPMVVYTEILYALTIVLLEVPTGIIADRWGRKRMMVLAACMGCCEFLILVFASEFWHFALAVALAAVGGSAGSGAEEALLYDSLRQRGKEQAFEKIFGRLNALDLVSTILAALSGSMLAHRFGFSLNYWMSLASAFVALILTLALAEPAAGGRREDDPPIPLRVYWTESLRFFKRHPGVRLTVLSGMAAGAAVSLLDEFWQTYLDRVEVPVLYFGVFSAAIFLLRLPGNLLAHRLKARFSYRNILSGAIAAMAAGFLVLALARDVTGAAALLLICLFSGILEPLTAGYLHHRIEDSSMRATIASFQSLGDNAALGLVGFGFGYFASRWDIFGGFGVLSAVCGGYLINDLLASRRYRE